MDPRLGVLLIFMVATGTMARHMNRIIGGHDVKKRSINNEALPFKVISTVDDYNPKQAKVDQILNELERKNLTFFKDVKHYETSHENATSNYLNMCQFETKEYIPTIIEDASGKRHHVLNSKNKIRQRFQFQTCLPSNLSQGPDVYETCEYSQTKPQSSAKCVQTYIKALVYTLSKTENKVMVKEFSVPSSCTCYVFSDEN